MTGTAPSAPERLDDLLQEAVREACLLESALERESQALAGRDLEALNQAVSGKHQMAQSLEGLTREQTALLRAGGFDPDGPGMDRCLRTWDEEGRMRPLWDRLQEVMARCRRLNQINGGVVTMQQQQVQQAIHVLRGEDSRTELYDPRGRSISSGASRSISKA